MRTLFEGRYLRLVDQGGWEFAQRAQATGVVGVLALTEDRIVLVEQHRPAVGARVLELPAGLAGDVAGAEDEALGVAAARELEEETGYAADTWDFLGHAPVSAGLTDETVSLFVARDLRRVGPGGGDSSEDIEVLEIPLAELRELFQAKQAAGVRIDPKIAAALWMARVPS